MRPDWINYYYECDGDGLKARGESGEERVNNGSCYCNHCIGDDIFFKD